MIHETIERLRVEVKRDTLQKQFEQLTWELGELEKKMARTRADATAVNGAIQVCQQLLDESVKENNKVNEMIDPIKEDEIENQDLPKDERFTEKKETEVKKNDG